MLQTVLNLMKRDYRGLANISISFCVSHSLSDEVRENAVPVTV